MADLCPCCKRPLDKLDSGLVVSLDCNTAARNGTVIHMPSRAIVIVDALNKRWPGTVTSEQMIQKIYGRWAMRAEDPLAVLKVKISGVRKSLKPLGVEIRNDYGVGYRLELL